MASTVTRMRGIWLGVSDLEATRRFYGLLGAEFGNPAPEGYVGADLAGTHLIFEPHTAQHEPRSGAYLLFDVPDADEVHAELVRAGVTITETPRNEPWGRQFDVLDPDGHPIALIGPATA